MSDEATLWILFILLSVAFVLCQVIFLRSERERERLRPVMPRVIRASRDQLDQIEHVRLIHPEEP